MPVYRLTRELRFPPPDHAEPDGLLAVGGDLSVARLRLAYAMGIFPCSSEGEPLLWWAPDPRFVLFPGEVRVPRSLRSLLRRQVFTMTVNQCFRQVIEQCRTVRRKRSVGMTGEESPDTWITPDMVEAYCALHAAGDALSVELWREGQLCGGFYGIRHGQVFCGESIFSRVSNAGKCALIQWAQTAEQNGIRLIDCQMETPLLKQLGGRFISRQDFQRWLKDGGPPP